MFINLQIIHFIVIYISLDNYNIITQMDYNSLYLQKELIGRGHYGRVYLVYQRQTMQPYVAKKIEFQGMTKQEEASTLKEVQIHKNLKHKNILEFKEYFLQSQVLIMIMEYCQFGDLSVYIKNQKQKKQHFDEPLIINWFVQMLFGLNYLHEHKILHRDIKTQNIFIDSQGTIKLADFGISKMLDHTQHLATTIVGTPYYLSPQACTNKGYSLKSDIWSLGCVLYELSTLEHPFKGDNILILAKKISSQQPEPISSQYSQQLAKIIKGLLKKKAQERVSLRQILQTRFISEYLIKFKMQDSIRENTQSEYLIFETQGQLQNQFLDIEYSNGNIKKVEKVDNSNKKSQKIKNAEEIQISPKKSGWHNLRNKCIQKMGEDLFHQIYNLMKSAHKNKMTESQLQSKLKDKYSKKEFELSMDVAQLIYLQESQKP